MRFRTGVLICLRIALVLGLLAMPAAVFVSLEAEGGTPALELQRQKRLARTLLLGGGASAVLAACGLYICGRTTRIDG
jgi:hypothetical protein